LKKTADHARGRDAGFSLVEMVGVLAIMSVLAALLLPKIFEAVRQAQLTATAAAISSVKGATMTYYAKYGRFGDVAGNTLTATNDASVLDRGTQVLLKGAYTEKPFRTPISDTALVRLRATVSSVTAPTASNTAYNLDGLDPNLNDSPDGRWVVEVFLTGLSLADALELNDRIDGVDSTLPDDLLNNRDTQGRVKYDATTTPCNVSVYISHR
jgi:prepilin-type N-terminal cleavage/methylation domain-containing protein